MTATTGPGEPHAFVTQPGQGVNYPRNLWHGVLTPIGEDAGFPGRRPRRRRQQSRGIHFFDEPLRNPPAVEDLTMADASLIDRLLDVIEHDIVPQDRRGRRARQQAVRRGDPAQIRPLAGAGRDQQRDREPALARRGALPEALLRDAQGRARRRRRTASSSPPTSPARSACRRSPGPASTISTTCSATRIRATASPSRTI